MSQDGFALITVLWVIAALAVLGLSATADLLSERDAALNRIALVRAHWAAEGCIALVQQRYQEAPGTVEVDSTTVSTDTWCALVLFRSADRIHLNVVDSTGLMRALGDAQLTAAVLDWRDGDTVPRSGGGEGRWYTDNGRAPPRDGPFRTVQEVRMVRGFDDAPPGLVEDLFTVRGDGRIDPTTAPVAVLRSLSALPEGAAERIAAARERGRAPQSPEEVFNVAGGTAAGVAYDRVASQTTYPGSQVELLALGAARVGDRILESRLVVTAVTLPERLALRRVEVER